MRFPMVRRKPRHLIEIGINVGSVKTKEKIGHNSKECPKKRNMVLRERAVIGDGEDEREDVKNLDVEEEEALDSHEEDPLQ